MGLVDRGSKLQTMGGVFIIYQGRIDLARAKVLEPPPLACNTMTLLLIGLSTLPAFEDLYSPLSCEYTKLMAPKTLLGLGSFIGDSLTPARHPLCPTPLVLNILCERTSR